MMIHLIPVSGSLELMEDLKQIYLDSFPADERREWKEMKKLLRHPHYKLNKIVDDNEIIGLISIWTWPDFIFIEHFALSESTRGQGLGTQVLKHITNENPPNIIVEVEEPYAEPAFRRINFYKRLGFSVCQEDYYQPPYSPGNNKVKMLLMSYPHLLTHEEFTTIKKQLYKDVYKWNNYTDFP